VASPDPARFLWRVRCQHCNSHSRAFAILPILVLALLTDIAFLTFQSFSYTLHLSSSHKLANELTHHTPQSPRVNAGLILCLVCTLTIVSPCIPSYLPPFPSHLI
jgi:hypothetical protein